MKPRKKMFQVATLIILPFLLGATAGCYAIVPMWRPTLVMGGTQTGFSAASVGIPVPGIPNSDQSVLESTSVPFSELVGKQTWRTRLWKFTVRNLFWIALVAFVIWLGGTSGLYWAWRRAKYAFGQVVDGAEWLKEEVQEALPKGKANDIMRSRHDNWVAEMVKKAKNKLK